MFEVFEQKCPFPTPDERRSNTRVKSAMILDIGISILER
jgi:hypothetical protein